MDNFQDPQVGLHTHSPSKLGWRSMHISRFKGSEPRTFGKFSAYLMCFGQYRLCSHCRTWTNLSHHNVPSHFSWYHYIYFIPTSFALLSRYLYSFDQFEYCITYKAFFLGCPLHLLLYFFILACSFLLLLHNTIPSLRLRNAFILEAENDRISRTLSRHLPLCWFEYNGITRSQSPGICHRYMNGSGTHRLSSRDYRNNTLTEHGR
jgi:hypothetical protein